MNAPSSVEDTAESAAEALPLPPGRRLGEFLITRVVGQGGFGIVYEAEDLALQRRIAIKEYMPSQLATRTDGIKVQPISARYAKTFELGRQSFIAEARLLAQFRHPGLLEVLHFWSQNGTAYMAMPFYEGRTLDKVLATSRGVISEKWLGEMIRPVLDALEHMHGEDCYHRDVSADNILIREDGKALLLDLGAARHVIGDRERALTMMLKPGYAPIEQYADDPACRQGPWTDIYAVSAVLYFAVTATMPPASASRVMHDSLPPLATLRPAGYGRHFLEAIDRGLSIRPEHRPRTVAEFRSLLFRASLNEVPASKAGGANARDASAGAAGSGPAEHSASEAHAKRGNVTRRADGASRTAGSRAERSRRAERSTRAGSSTRAESAARAADPTRTDGATRADGSTRAEGSTRADGEVRANGSTRAASPTGADGPGTQATVRAESAKSASRGKRPAEARNRVPLFAAAALVCAVAVAWIAWPTSRTAANGEGASVPLAQRHGAALALRGDAPSAQPVERAVAGDPLATKFVRGPAAQDVGAPSSTPSVEDAPRPDAAGSSPQRPAGTVSQVQAKRPTGAAAPARSTRPSSAKASTAAAERSKQGAASTGSPVAAGAAAKTSSGADDDATAAKTGSLRLSVAPWGEVFVDGTSRGVTPPLKQLELSAGTHRIEIRNPAGPSWSKQVVVRAGQQEVVSHRFR